MRLLDRLRERELFRTVTPEAYPVGDVYYERDAAAKPVTTWRVTRHKSLGYSPFVEVKIPPSTIIYGVQKDSNR
jgi:hypothetical protein